MTSFRRTRWSHSWWSESFLVFLIVRSTSSYEKSLNHKLVKAFIYSFDETQIDKLITEKSFASLLDFPKINKKLRKLSCGSDICLVMFDHKKWLKLDFWQSFLCTQVLMDLLTKRFHVCRRFWAFRVSISFMKKLLDFLWSHSLPKRIWFHVHSGKRLGCSVWVAVCHGMIYWNFSGVCLQCKKRISD